MPAKSLKLAMSRLEFLSSRIWTFYHWGKSLHFSDIATNSFHNYYIIPVYNKELEADVKGDTSGFFQRLLVGCLQANRPEGTEFDRNKAKQDAQVIMCFRFVFSLTAARKVHIFSRLYVFF